MREVHPKMPSARLATRRHRRPSPTSRRLSPRAATQQRAGHLAARAPLRSICGMRRESRQHESIVCSRPNARSTQACSTTVTPSRLATPARSTVIFGAPGAPQPKESERGIAGTSTRSVKMRVARMYDDFGVADTTLSSAS